MSAKLLGLTILVIVLIVVRQAYQLSLISARITTDDYLQSLRERVEAAGDEDGSSGVEEDDLPPPLSDETAAELNITQKKQVKYYEGKFFTTKESSEIPSVIFVYPKGEYGLLCNILHEVSNALDVAMTFPIPSKRVVLAFEWQFGKQFESAIDVDMLIRTSTRMSTLDLSYLGLSHYIHDVDVIFDWDSGKMNSQALKRGHVILNLKLGRLMRMRRQEYSIALTYALRPHPNQRRQAEQVVYSYRTSNPGDYLISVHRRHFVWCQPKVKAYGPFCTNHDPIPVSDVTYYDDDCNVTLTPALLGNISQEFLGRGQLPTFSWFIATDLHDKAGDETFIEWSRLRKRDPITIPHLENPEHAVTSEWAKKQQRGESTGGKHLAETVKEQFDFVIHWDLSMFVDMHAQTLADFSLGAPWSSCDRILAMWRSISGKAALSAYLESVTWDGSTVSEHKKRWETKLGATRQQMFPSKCYRAFEKPQKGEYKLAVRMAKWWGRDWRHILNKNESQVSVGGEAQNGIGEILLPDMGQRHHFSTLEGG